MRVTFLRHGVNRREGDNFSRPLTELGRKQAVERRKALGNPSFDFVLTSPALRACQTAEIIGSGAIFRVVNELWPDPSFIQVCMAVLDKSGWLPLLSVYLAEGEETILAGGKTAWDVVQAYINEHACKDVLVVGHNPLMQSMGCAAAKGFPGMVKALETTRFLETEGFTITFKNGAVTDFEVHRN